MKVSPRPLSQGTAHNRTAQHSSKSHKEHKLQSTVHNLKSKGRNDYSERYSNSKTTILLPEKKLNRSNINTFSETTLTSQLLLESVCRDSESRSRGKISDKGNNSKENTMIAGQSISNVANKITQIPLDVQLQELRSLYEIKEIEAKKLQEENNTIKNKLEQASDYLKKSKQLHSLIQSKEMVIGKLKENLGQATKELEELKLQRKGSLTTSRDGNQSARENKKVLIRVNSLTSKPKENKTLDSKFKMYMDGLSYNESSSSMKVKIPLMNLSSKHSKIHISGNQSARGNISEHSSDNDNYLLNQHFGSKAKAQAMTERNEYIEHKTMGQIRRETPIQFSTKKWPINDSGSGAIRFCSEYNDMSIEENSLRISNTQKVMKIKNSHVIRNEYSDWDSKSVQTTSIADGLNALISKFGKVLDTYRKSEVQIMEKNKELEEKLQAYMKKKKQKE